ncbi:MAG: hypothetical protein HKN35_11100 [Woeseia sp.]|nr:hypothetical protein [Woeseia sp.]MBT8097601.1 hypothetical protein [Woeseia sp.]NNE61434.1 hypothetical protein [Woeseia sp.]NNL53916.1 hypothetical protein [Woeseia sp.]
MWLPEKVYLSLPWVYVAIGLLFFVGVYYIDQRDFLSGFYFAIGMVSITCGLIVHYLRVNAPAHNDAESDGDSAPG